MHSIEAKHERTVGRLRKSASNIDGGDLEANVGTVECINFSNSVGTRANLSMKSIDEILLAKMKKFAI